jgi:trk system potassium uptake protein TrkH
MAVVACAWLSMSLFGALPYFLSGEITSFADCIFETASGLTTTGATIMDDIEGTSRACLFWRSFTHWIGGMGVLVFMLAVLPQGDTRTMHIVRAESPGPTVGKLAAKMSFSVRILYGMYLILTALEAVLLLFGGMPLFDAVTTAFSTAGTGGFAITNNSIADYNSPYIECVVMVFMLLFSVNFTIFYLLLTKKIKQVFKNEELRVFLCICICSILLIAVNILQTYGNFLQALRYAGFQVLSIISTTGFATADYTQWPVFSQILLLLLMFVGGCAGSTGGGLKVSRVIILFKTALREIRCVLNPRSVVIVRCEGKALDKDVLRGVSSYFILYSFLSGISMLLLSLDGQDALTTITAVITCLNNVGPGLGTEIGPSGNFAGFSSGAKLLLSMDMLLGRLEIYPILVLFTMRKRNC